MLRRPGFLFGLILTLFVPSEAFSECSLPLGTVCLDFASLPSAQGWVYYSPIGPTPPEEEVFSADGTRLAQDTMGMGSGTAIYLKNNALDPLIPFTVSVRARVLQSESAMSGGVATAFAVNANTGREIFSFSLNSDTMDVGGMKFPFDNTEFHDYRLEIVPRASYAFYVDDSLLVTGLPRVYGGSGWIMIGDSSTSENGLVEIEKFCVARGITVELAIRSDGGDKIHRRSKGNIPVAVLTTGEFDAALIDLASVRFGPDGAMEVHGGGHFEDVDGDGDVDLVLHFANRDTGIFCDESFVSLTGRTVDGMQFGGCQDIQAPECRPD
jgi:hypothetical protein